MARSFLERMQPKAERAKLVKWAFPTPEGDTPLVRLRILGGDEIEQAQLEVDEFYRKGKVKLDREMPAYEARLRAALTWRAYETPEGDRLTPSAEEFFTYPIEVIGELYAEWKRYQEEITVRPMKAAEMDELIAELKKNTRMDLLSALPSTWLIALTTTLVSQQSASIQAVGAGS
jgi:hypothetical protein